MIDWKFAQATATRLSRPGPEMSAAEVAEAVEELRVGAARSEAPVRDFTGLHSTHALGAPSPVLVVDRPRWVEANLSTFQLMMDPINAKLAETSKLPTGLSRSVGEKVSGAELGALMSFMSTKVLGQFDPFWTGPHGEGGRLLLVAPNIVAVQRQLDVDPHDFRLWVCLHEETHRVQFTGVPWLREHLRSLMEEFIDATDLDPQAMSAMLQQALSQAVKVAKGDPNASLASMFQNERQSQIVDQMTGVMSLLEGHADVVMDDVGPEVIPTVAHIRRKFSQRRAGGSGIDRLIRRLLGLEAKMAQYRDGAVFVRHAIDTIGMDGFNAVWSHPSHLPTRSEILEPSTWVSRVHA
ncbi:MAG: zinc-dependent metalloprotease [Aeromicrobium sp.]|uniref:zinc-dependent metalloprotease n=1 Tax=Aeromicrobium sp. TaxID=1871063 RepID=UPI003C54069E